MYLPKVETGGHVEFLIRTLFPAVKPFFPEGFQRHDSPYLSYQRGLVFAPYSNYELLMGKLAQGPRVGLFFLAPFEGYDTEGVWKQVKLATLPKGFSLPGVLEIVMLLCMYGSSFRPGMNSCSLDATGLQLVHEGQNNALTVYAESPRWIQHTDDPGGGCSKNQKNIRALLYTGVN